MFRPIRARTDEEEDNLPQDSVRLCRALTRHRLENCSGLVTQIVSTDVKAIQPMPVVAMSYLLDLIRGLDKNLIANFLVQLICRSTFAGSLRLTTLAFFGEELLSTEKKYEFLNDYIAIIDSAELNDLTLKAIVSNNIIAKLKSNPRTQKLAAILQHKIDFAEEMQSKINVVDYYLDTIVDNLNSPLFPRTSYRLDENIALLQKTIGLQSANVHPLQLLAAKPELVNRARLGYLCIQLLIKQILTPSTFNILKLLGDEEWKKNEDGTFIIPPSFIQLPLAQKVALAVSHFCVFLWTDPNKTIKTEMMCITILTELLATEKSFTEVLGVDLCELFINMLLKLNASKQKINGFNAADLVNYLVKMNDLSPALHANSLLQALCPSTFLGSLLASYIQKNSENLTFFKKSTAIKLAKKYEELPSAGLIGDTVRAVKLDLQYRLIPGTTIHDRLKQKLEDNHPQDFCKIERVDSFNNL